MKELTKAEEQLMHYVWTLEKAFLKDIVESYPEPRPAYTTISTVIRVLVKKGFLAFKTYGKVHEYYATISKEAYFGQHFKKVIRQFFNGSVTSFTSAFTNSESLDLSELEEMKRFIESKINELKENDD